MKYILLTLAFSCIVLTHIVDISTWRQNVDQGYLRDDGVMSFLGKDYTISEIPTKGFTDLVSHLLGTCPVSSTTTDRTWLPATSIFKKPRANVLFIVSDTGKADLKGYDFQNFQKLHDLKKADGRIDSVAYATTLMTGQQPFKHGILGKFWRDVEGNRIEAFSENGQRLVANLADVIAQTTEGKSEVLSASADRHFSAALGVHPKLVKEHPEWNTKTIYFNGKDFQTENGNTVAVPETKVIELPRDKLVYDANTQSWTFSKTVSFNMKDMVDRTFMAEVELFLQLAKELDTNTNLKDEHPDLLQFAFSSLRAIAKREVIDTPKYRAALRIVDQVITIVMNSVQKATGDRAIGQVVALGSIRSYREEFERVQATSNSTGGDVTPADVGIYHVCLWTALILILALIAVIMALMYMPLDVNTLLTRPAAAGPGSRAGDY